MAFVTLLAYAASCMFMTASALDPPYFVGYIDYPTCAGAGTSTADAACLANLGVPGYTTTAHPFNVLNFAFYVSTQDLLYDAAKVWANPSTYFSSSFRAQITGTASPTDAQFRSAIKAKYAAAGIKIILSVFGATDHPMPSISESSLLQSGGLRDKIVNLVNTYDFDGVDLDFEQTTFFERTTAGISWLCTLTDGLRASLGSSKIITHAPMAPYLGASYSNTNRYTNGAYLAVHETCGGNIDWYNVQFYNQGSTTYDTYATLFQTANGWSETTAVFQITGGQNPLGKSIPAEKLVVGKFVRSGVDGSAGWVSAANMKSFLQTAMQSQQVAGFMIWQYYGDVIQDFAWSNTVASAWDGVSVSTTSSTTTTTTTTSSGGNSAVSVALSVTYGCTCGSSCSSGVCWYFSLLVTPPSGVSITSVKVRNSGSSSWIDAEWGSSTAWGFGSGTSYITPLRVQVQTSSGTVYGTLTSISTGSTSTVNSAAAFEGDESAETDSGVHWTVWFAVIVSILVVVAVVIACVAWYRRKNNKGTAGFQDDHPEQIEVETQMVNEDAETETTR